MRLAGIRGNRIGLLDPAGAHRCDLAVGRPAIGGEDLAEVGDLPREDGKHDRSHDKADRNCSPVFAQLQRMRRRARRFMRSCCADIAFAGRVLIVRRYGCCARPLLERTTP